MELHDHVHASTLLIDICLAPVQHLQLLGREQSLIHAYQCVHHVPACVHEHNARRACRPASLVDVRRNVFVDMLYAAAGFDLLALDRACGCNMVAWVHLPRSCLVDLGDSVFVDLSFTSHLTLLPDCTRLVSMLLFKSLLRAKRCISTFHGTGGSCLTNTRDWKLPRAV